MVLEKLFDTRLDFGRRQACQPIHGHDSGDKAALDISALDIDAVEGL